MESQPWAPFPVNTGKLRRTTVSREPKAKTNRPDAQMFVALSFTAAERRKQPKRPPASEWRNEMWSFFTMEYYSAAERNEFLTHVTT